jgi:hypothetical protein
MRNRILFWSISTSFVSAVTMGVAQQRAPDVDLTLVNRPIELEDEAIDTVLGGGISSERPEKPSVSLRLLRVDPPSCEAGGAITYDVAMKNITGRELRIPVSVDRRYAGTSDDRVTFPVISFSLEVFDRTELVDAGETTYGNSLDSWTTRMIGPGQDLVVRIGGTCRLVTTHQGKPAKPGVNEVQVVAVAYLRRSANSFGLGASSPPRSLKMNYPREQP